VGEGGVVGGVVEVVAGRVGVSEDDSGGRIGGGPEQVEAPAFQLGQTSEELQALFGEETTLLPFRHAMQPHELFEGPPGAVMCLVGQRPDHRFVTAPLATHLVALLLADGHEVVVEGVGQLQDRGYLVGPRLDRPSRLLQAGRQRLGGLLGEGIEDEPARRVSLGHLGDERLAPVPEGGVVVGDVGVAGEEDLVTDPAERDERFFGPDEQRLAFVVAGHDSVEVGRAERARGFGDGRQPEALLYVDGHWFSNNATVRNRPTSSPPPRTRGLMTSSNPAAIARVTTPSRSRARVTPIAATCPDPVQALTPMPYPA